MIQILKEEITINQKIFILRNPKKIGSVMMRQSNRALESSTKAYKEITKRKDKFGIFHKTLFHVHTPASYDFHLTKNYDQKSYQALNENDIYKLCLEYYVFPKDTSIDAFIPTGVYEVFSSTKECLTYIFYAKQIIANDISIVVVSDHNTINGVKKLEVAISEVMKNYKNNIYPQIIMGIEISCADKNHVVGIFENNDNSKDQINIWLKDNLLNVKEGSFLTSLEVLSIIDTIGGIGYLAHIDISETFNEKSFSGAFKKKMLNFNKLSFVGLSDYSKKNIMEKRIRTFRSSSINFIIDNDSHSIEGLSEKYFWVKGSKKNFFMIKEALNDFDISISFSQKNYIEKYIKGVYIEKDKIKDGFLSGKSGKETFCLTFSEALNCIIGGRGTGKSTVLQVLEYALSQRCDSVGSLEFICNHGDIWILYMFKQEEYLINMSLPYKEFSKDSVLRSFGQNLEGRFSYRYHFDESDIVEYSRKEHLSIYRVEFVKNDMYLETVSNKKAILKGFFDTRYSVNKLVQTASSDEINQFLFNVLFENKTLARPSEVIKFRSKNGLINALKDVEGFLGKRNLEVHKVINPFNENQKGILKIIYSQKEQPDEPDIVFWIFRDKYTPNNYYKKRNLTNENVFQFIISLIDKIGICKLLQIVFDGNYNQLNNLSPIGNFLTPMTMDMIDQGIIEIKQADEIIFVKEILEKLIAEGNIELIINYLKEYVTDIESFSLEFNLNNKESSKSNNMLFRDVRLLSLGQKVVAMLSFILGYSVYCNDFRPLLIDQPEDNLDNQYIYKNLVKQLREIKSKRQVIIATHSATIVTNAKADQVVLMESDYNHGWVETTGYPSEEKIKKHIINYLEGGIDSFNHKYSIYKEVL